LGRQSRFALDERVAAAETRAVSQQMALHSPSVKKRKLYAEQM